MGQRIADYANELFAANAYRDYLEVHGLSVQLTEALAEFWHQRIRSELIFPDGGSRGRRGSGQRSSAFFDLGYRGARYSFGYPACPDLTDQDKLVPLLEPERIGVSCRRSTSCIRSSRRRRWSPTTPRRTYFAAR